MDILEYLVEQNYITSVNAESLKKKSEDNNVSIIKLLGESEIEEDVLLQSLSKISGVPVKKIDIDIITKDILDFIPQESAKIYQFIPIGFNDGALEVGVVDPDNIEARDALNFISTRNGAPYKIYIISQKQFDEIFDLYKGLSSEVTEALSEIEEGKEEEGESKNQKPEKPDEIMPEIAEIANKTDVSKATDEEDVRIIEDAPVTKIVATILRYATEGNASDVHLEHMRESIRVRFRVDGVLNTSLILPREVYSAVVARIKILSNMKLDEKRRPQDGRFSAKIDGRKIDFRVSTFPTYYGEKVVMRILDQGKGVRSLDELSLSTKNLEAIKRALGKPYGIILVSGPTGSGKTTTLYSMLKEINSDGKNILSLEDPIEYNISGINQSQMRPDIGYTFANGLRTTLRQDPDIIMVGEIRDKETAQLAIQAALTGHLVFSTIHTNNAFGVIPRLIDMGVDPYLIAPTLTLAIAQRLVRKKCDDAGVAVPVEGSVKIMIDKEFESVPEEVKKDLEFTDTVYNSAPSPTCPNGTMGRAAVMELIEMDKELEAAVLEDPTEINITKITRKQGFLTMKQDAILKAMKGEIPFEEVNTM
jgi:type IV pilus assembly protein PilB